MLQVGSAAGSAQAAAPSPVDLQSAWRAEGRVRVLQGEAQRLTFALDGREGGLLRIGIPRTEAVWLRALRIRVRSNAALTLRLAWRFAGQETLVRGSRWHEIVGMEQWQTIDLDIRRQMIARGDVVELAIVLPVEVSATVAVEAPQLVLAGPTAAATVEIGGRVRRALCLEPDSGAEWELVVPPGGLLQFGFALREPAWTQRGDGCSFEVLLIDGRTEHRLWHAHLNPYRNPRHRNWHSARVDLAEWGGRLVRLRLVARAGASVHGIFPASTDTGGDLPVFSAPRIVSTADARPNIVVVLIDTLRPDGLGLYGNHRAASPRLDAFARDAAVFELAYAPSSWTHPSTGSLLSGWMPSRHGLGWGAPGTTQLHPEATMLAEWLSDAGYATAAVSNNVIVSPDEGFGWGFDSFDVRPFEQDQVYGAHRVTEYARQWLDETGAGPFFLYLHYFDPHDRYQAPPPHTRMFVDPELVQKQRPSGIVAGRPTPLRAGLRGEGPPLEISPDDVSYLRALYDGEVHYSDHWVGLLLDDLRARGLFDKTWILVTSDHGEEFLEHGMLKHGHSLHEELIRVPLLLRAPDSPRNGQRWRVPVSLLDVVPTLTRLAGAQSPPAAPLARDLGPWLAGGPEPASTPLLAENFSHAPGRWDGRQRATLQGSWKLIEYLDQKRRELFRLDSDPLEQVDLSDDRRGQVLVMQATTDSLMADGTPAQAPVAGPDPELIKKLKAMGYVD
jgi:arylsulfatase A-like enzyme